MTPAVPADEPTQHCVRCGAIVPLDTAMCERCNPLGLKQPAPSQAHGTVVLAIVVAVIALALLGKASLGGVGPFQGRIGGIAPAPDGLAVTLTVQNQGTSRGSTTCRVYDPSTPGLGPDAAFVLSPEIEAGGQVTFTKPVIGLGSVVRPLAVECTGP
jgi:predicted nucleic acid-binding Zn ribbon protein